ncbi:hypothetical protein PUN28_001531 [Cardiocondyla obscurior]|uniref:Uncharacterized protein n=1 Tax=Cardiocondyla obscurior TaxID=286306 RepID=A0AAW2H608_9HYME
MPERIPMYNRYQREDSMLHNVRASTPFSRDRVSKRTMLPSLEYALTRPTANNRKHEGATEQILCPLQIINRTKNYQGLISTVSVATSSQNCGENLTFRGASKDAISVCVTTIERIINSRKNQECVIASSRA